MCKCDQRRLGIAVRVRFRVRILVSDLNVWLLVMRLVNCCGMVNGMINDYDAG